MDAAKPAVQRLGPFLDQARLFVRDGEPTIRDLSRTITRQGPNNDLIELIKSFPPLAHVAMDDQRVNGADRRGAFPETTDALKAAAPTIAFGRPYTPDFVGWMDDFSTTGGYDAHRRLLARLDQLLRDPLRGGPEGAAVPPLPGRERASGGATAATSSRPTQAAALDCDPNQRSVGP